MELPEPRVSPTMTYTILSALYDIQSTVHATQEAVNTISRQLEELSTRVTDYQELASRQVGLSADNEELQELVLKSFTDTCVDRIMSSVNTSNAGALYDNEERRLVESLGGDAWGKLDEDSKRFLISSKFMYSRLVDIDDAVDYSGVCLLVTKALELELGKRFCTGYVQYYKEAHPGRRAKRHAPAPLLDKNGGYISAKDFTLGSFPYITGKLSAKDRDGNVISDEDKQRTRDCMLEYAKERLLRTYSSNHSDEDVLDLLDDYERDIDRVRKYYRNPSAHTNALTRISARECFDLVLDVEKLLRTMLESFDV